jgi:hypothetical protein
MNKPVWPWASRSVEGERTCSVRDVLNRAETQMIEVSSKDFGARLG